MATEVRLGTSSSYLTLTDNTNYLVLDDGIDLSDAFGAARERIITLSCLVFGSTTDNLMANVQALYDRLEQANRAAHPSGNQDPVRVSVKIGNATNYVHYLLLPATRDGNGSTLTLGPRLRSTRIGAAEQPATLTLRVMPFGEGDLVSKSTSSTINASSPTHYEADCAGDVDGPGEIEIADTSTSGNVINRFIIGRRSMPSMADSAFSPVLDVTASGAGSDTAEADTIGSSLARMTPTKTWQRAGHVAMPAAANTKGTFHLYSRIRDATVSMPGPTAVDATTTAAISVRQALFNAGSSSTATADWGQDTLAGNHVIMLLVVTSNVTATTPSGWTRVGTGFSDGTRRIECYYIEDAAARSGTESVSLSGSTAFYLYLFEVAGIADSSSFDDSASNSGTSGGAVSTGTIAALAQNNELVLVAGVSTGGLSSWNGYTQVSAGQSRAGYLVDADGGSASGTSSTSAGADWLAAVLAFKGISTIPGSLPAGTYQYKIVALDGSNSESGPSDPLALITSVTSAVTLTWDAPAFGTVAGYRVYWQRDGGSWKYLDTGSTNTTYTHTTESGATTADPPLDVPERARLRAKVLLESGTTASQTTEPVAPVLANDEWEWLYMGTVTAPGMVTPLNATLPDWRIEIEAKHDGTPDDLDVDAIALLDATEPVVIAEYAGLDLAAARTWIIGSDRYGRRYGFLTDSGNEAGQVAVSGRFTVAADDNEWVFLASIADGVAAVDDVSWTVRVRHVPRFRGLRGSS